MGHPSTLSLWVQCWPSGARRKAPTMLAWVLVTLHSALQTCDGNNHNKYTDGHMLLLRNQVNQIAIKHIDGVG